MFNRLQEGRHMITASGENVNPGGERICIRMYNGYVDPILRHILYFWVNSYQRHGTAICCSVSYTSLDFV